MSFCDAANRCHNKQIRIYNLLKCSSVICRKNNTRPQLNAIKPTHKHTLLAETIPFPYPNKKNAPTMQWRRQQSSIKPGYETRGRLRAISKPSTLSINTTALPPCVPPAPSPTPQPRIFTTFAGIPVPNTVRVAPSPPVN